MLKKKHLILLTSITNGINASLNPKINGVKGEIPNTTTLAILLFSLLLRIRYLMLVI